MAKLDGATRFLRCGDCETMYRAEETIIPGGPMWLRPKPIRANRAKDIEKCNHPNDAVQAWNGEWWESVNVKERPTMSEGDEF